VKSPKRLVRKDSAPHAKIVPVRLPADLVGAIDTFASAAEPTLPASTAMRMLIRAGLAAHHRTPFDLQGTAFHEGWAAGHAAAVETHQRALYEAGAKLGKPAA